MTAYTKVSVSLPAHLLLLAKHSHLQAPDESLSAFLARLLGDALRRRDEQGDLDLPPTVDEDQVSDAFARAGLTSAFDASSPSDQAAERTQSGRGGVQRGDIWLAEVAGVAGAHPVVLLSLNETYARRRRATVAIITSQSPRRSTEIAVDEHNGLDHASIAKADDLHTIRTSELIEHLGALDAEQQLALDAALRLALGLAA